MKLSLNLLFVFFVFNTYGQQDGLELEIINSTVVKERRQDAIKLEVQLSGFDKKADTIYLYKFYKYIPSMPFVYDSISLNKYKDVSIGLNYVIENSDGGIIEAKELLQPSFAKAKEEIRHAAQKEQVNKRTLKIKRVKVDYTELHNYQLSKLLLLGNDTVVNLYPLLSSYHDLNSGKYKLYLFYSFNDEISLNPPTSSLWDSDKPNNSLIFKGVIVSNKIDLIVK